MPNSLLEQQHISDRLNLLAIGRFRCDTNGKNKRDARVLNPSYNTYSSYHSIPSVTVHQQESETQQLHLLQSHPEVINFHNTSVNTALQSSKTNIPTNGVNRVVIDHLHSISNLRYKFCHDRPPRDCLSSAKAVFTPVEATSRPSGTNPFAAFTSSVIPPTRASVLTPLSRS